MKKTIALLYTALLLPAIALAQEQNYVQTTTYKTESWAPISSPSAAQAVQTITYLDGLGRPMQQRSYRQSGTGTDLVTHFAYDAFGRQAKEYLPYPTQSASLAYDSGAEAGVMSFYGTLPSPPLGAEITGNPYSEKLLENSHLNRVIRQAAPGNPWGMGTGHEVKMAYDTNTAADGVKNYSAMAVWNNDMRIYDVSLSSANYSPGQLYKNTIKNENWTSTSGLDNTTEEFTDNEGRIILKRAYDAGVRHDTYYVYDQFGNLSYVFPPLAGNPIVQLDDLCYQYKYDHRNRLVEKKLPGRQWQFMAYDKLDRLVATGPTFSPFDGSGRGWLITKYDPLGRIAYTGWYQNTGTRKAIQDQINTSNLSEIRTASQMVDNISVGYSNKVFPTSGMNVLTISWYDDYSYPGAPTVFGPVEGQVVFYDNTTDKPKGLQTGSWTRALEAVSLTAGELTSTLYDHKGRPISLKSTNYLGGHILTDSKLDFTGRPVYTITKHQRTIDNTEFNIREDFAYDLQDRLLSHTHKIGNLPAELLALNSYDKLGRLSYKKTGGSDTSGNTFYQKTDYSYNIRGWLKSINSIENFATDDGGTDLFAFTIRYNDLNGAYDAGLKPLYNGNICETQWMSRSDSRERSYSYNYDVLDRLRTASYFKDRNYTKSYDEWMDYDKNGNILHMGRFGELDYPSVSIQIDDLDYIYGNGNQLKMVKDNSLHPSGFKDGADLEEEYKYDANGNMISDENKRIETIIYNHMDLPIEISFQTGAKINYLYDASGKKLKKTVWDGIDSVSTDYLSGFQYVSEVLDFFATAEGYVKYIRPLRGRPAQFNYVFNINDHLGNIRMSYGMDKEKSKLYILEENHYYPFGLKHEKYNSDKYEYVEISKEEGGYIIGIEPLGPQQRKSYQYKYNGKEFQSEMGMNVYDYENRTYDPANGRWWQMDPMAEQGRRWSPYAYAMDNPIYFIDPDGMWPWPSWSTVKAVGGAIATKISNTYNSSKLARDIPKAYENSGVKKVVDWTKSKVNPAKPDKPDKVKTKGGTSFTAEGGKAGAMATPEGDRSVKPVDMTIFMTIATDVYGPETTMPGAAPDGSNPFETNNGGGEATESTMSTANSGEEEMVTAQTETYTAAEAIGGGRAAPAQVVLTKSRDTLVKKSEVKNVQSQNQKRYEEQKVKI